MQISSHFSKHLKSLLISCFMVAITFTVTSCEKDTLETHEPLSASIEQQQGAIVPGKYIVVFKDDVDFGLDNLQSYDKRQDRMRQASQGILRAKGIPADRIEHVYGKAIKGLSARLSAAELKQLQKDPRVAYIERDRVIQLAPPPGKGPNKGGDEGGSSGQDIPWGITRVGGAGDGIGKTAWVIDTGIDLNHKDLNVDAGRSRTMFTSGKDAKSADDGNGHGTHVAGTIAAIDNLIGVIGVAAGATVVAVKVLDSRGSGSYSGVIAGVDYVADNASAGDVANMSLGGPTSNALDAAILDAASNGIKFALAAGNDGAHASNSSPARVNHDNVVTISAIDISDNFASWSNWGNPPVDFAAPGVSIQSTWKGGGYNSISGTSMAAPHVAGLLLFGNVYTNCSSQGSKSYPIAYRFNNTTECKTIQ
jgi:subtilisin family serine protease